MKKPKQTNSMSSPVFYLNCMLAIAVILIGVVYQFFVKPDGELDEVEGGLGRKTEGVLNEIPPYPLFTADDLAQYDGEKKPQLYLAIMGDIFDVSRGAKHYGKDQPYNAFVGNDMSRAFVTGEFDKKSDKDTLDHVLSLSPAELVDLKNWRDFYANSEDYNFVGRLIGRFYQEDGLPTEYFWQIERKIQFGLKQKAEERDLRSAFPPCNLEYKNKMTRFWCTNRSGGIDRDWAGYPIQLFDQDTKTYTCVCLEKERFDLPQLRQYEKCDDATRSCFNYDEEQKDDD